MNIKTFFLILCIHAFASCGFHLYSKDEAIKVVQKRAHNVKDSITIEDNNNVLRVLSTNRNFRKLDVIYHFNDDGEQTKYTLIASCDSCFQKYLTKALANRGYGWKKLDDSTYLSKYSLKRTLNIHRSTYTYEIVKHNLSDEEFNKLLTKDN